MMAPLPSSLSRRHCTQRHWRAHHLSRRTPPHRPRGAHGRYRIPLTQHKGGGNAAPLKKARQTLRHANSVYDLPSTEQAIRWMHAVCGYPVKSTWLKALQAGNFIGWPLLTSRNIQKYFPESVETPKGHLNQSHKNVRSTKQKPIPLETFQSPQLVGRKLRDVYTHVYDTRDTIFSDQTGKFPHRSSSGNHYLMVMVDIDSSAILVEPIKNRTDLELTRAYSTLITRLHQAGVVPRKHVLDNEISTAMKTLITDTYKMTYELVPPGCHRRNAAEVAIRNFKSHFLMSRCMKSPTLAAHGPSIPSAAGTSAHHLSITRAHRCHIKSTNSERLSDTVVFQHKSITHPSLTPTDKLMQAVSACAAALKGITAPTKDITDLKALLDITQPPHTPPTVFQGNTPSLPRVLPTNDTATSRVTRSMTNQFNLPSTTPVAIPTPRPTTKTKRRRHTKCAAVPDSAPAYNTRSHTAAKAKLLAAPATNTSAKRISRIPKPVPILSTQRVKRVDKKSTGPGGHGPRTRNTPQLPCAPPTPSIPRRLDHILCQRDKGHQHHTLHPSGISPKTALKTSRTVNSCAPHDPKRKNPIAARACRGRDESTTR
eukprot:CCRYP_009625-RA/>CCRYP_009625-RA protein AED:0.25 eAED:0.25 QI:0/0/0/1/0/0/4/0/596